MRVFRHVTAPVAGLALAVAFAACSSNTTRLTPVMPQGSASPTAAASATAMPSASASAVASATPTAGATATPTGAPTAAPTATATPAPTPTPAGTPLISIAYQNSFNALDFPGAQGGGCGTAYDSITFVASESTATTFTATSSNPSQVAISPASGSGTFTATVSATNTNYTPGTVVVKDAAGNAVTANYSFNVVCL